MHNAALGGTSQSPPIGDWKRVSLFSFVISFLLPSLCEIKMKTMQPQAACRYGRGCTHTSDEAHCARYWHPGVPLLAQHIRKRYYCILFLMV